MANEIERELSEAETTSESSKSKYINGFEKFLFDELKCRIVPGYSRSPIFVKMRPALIAYATKYKSESEDVYFPVIAATIEYADMFLSRRKKIPVVVRNGGAKLHFQIFVFACAMLAYKDYNIFDDLFTEADFVEEPDVAQAKYIWEMRDQIREGIDGVKQPPASPWDGLDDFYDLLTKDENISLQRLPMWEILVAIRRDIKFTEFKQSTLVAAAVLVTSLKFQPELYSWFSERIFQRYHKFFNESEVKRCLSEMEGHVIVEEVFAHPKQPRLLRDIPGDEKKKGKKPMNQEYSVDDLSEKLAELDIDDLCEKFTEFDNDWLEPVPGSPPDSP